MNVLNTLFADIFEGRLNRLQFLGYWALLAGILIAGSLALAFGIGIAEQMLSEDAAATQKSLLQRFGAASLVGLAAVIAILIFAELNLSAKRVRDIGLPAWPTTLVAAAAIVFVSIALSLRIGQSLSVLAWLALLMTPGGIAGRDNT